MPHHRQGSTVLPSMSWDLSKEGAWVGLCKEVTVRRPPVPQVSKDLLKQFCKYPETNAEVNLAANCPLPDYFYLEITPP